MDNGISYTTRKKFWLDIKRKLNNNKTKHAHQVILSAPEACKI